MSLLTVLGILAAVVAVPAIIDLVRRGDLRRMAVRNAARRPVETALVIIGSALGTAIIAAALMVGDTFDESIRDIARRNLGEIDLIVTTDEPVELDFIESELRAEPPSMVDGIMRFHEIGLAAAAGDPADPNRAVEPRILVSAIDFADAAVFGEDPDTYSVIADDPGLEGVVVNGDLADDLGVGVGDAVTLFALGTEIELDVSAVIPEAGMGGFSHAFVSEDLFETLGVSDSTGSTGLALSLDGTIFDSIDATDAGVDAVFATYGGEFFADPGTEVRTVKRDLVNDAEEEGAELTTIFSVVGGFSVMAGVLLLINLFVMLSEERKPNLGVLRAVGWKRGTMRRAFRAEGIVYSLPAAAVGAVLGIGVGWVIVRITQNLFAADDPEDAFQLITAVRPSSLLTAALIGLIIAMGAIWFTSWRISRLNIVTAIRDLPEPKTQRSTWIRLGTGALSIVVGALALVTGVGGSSPYIAIVSVPLIVIGLVLLLRSTLPPMVLTTVGALIVLVWAIAFFEVMPDDTVIDIEFFLLYGAVMVGAGVALASVSGVVLQRLIARRGGDVPARLAMAYPTARAFRTASSLAMYSLIIFSLAFMAVMSSGIERQGDDIVVNSAAGHDILVATNTTNPIDGDTIVAEIDGVVAANPVVRMGGQFLADFDPEVEFPEWEPITAPTAAFATTGAPKLSERDPRFGSDVEALQYVLDNDAALVPKWFLGDEDGFDPSIGDTIQVEVLGGTLRDLEIVGVTDDDYTWSGVWVSRNVAEAVEADPVPWRIYVDTEDGADSAAIADRIEARFFANGAEAETFADRVGRIVATDLGFFSLLRGYLLLGLIIGIGGLAVTLFRAVRERRRQIGMLRSMGLANGGVGRWFLGEATYISLMGIVCGIGLGVLSAYFVVTRSNATGDQVPFVVPWVVLIVIVAIPFVASGIAALVPARRAAALRPSEALRLAD